MDLHKCLMEMCKEHVKIKKGGYADLLFFDLKRHSIKNGKTVLMENGKIIPQTISLTDGRNLVLEDDLGEINEEFYSGVEARFEKYYLSMPGKADKFVRTNFMAKNLEKMTYAELMAAGSNDRCTARYELEWFVLANAIKGNIPWTEGNYFWQSSRMPKLIIYKEWLGGTRDVRR